MSTTMKLIGRKAYLDWGDKIVAIEIYAPNENPKNIDEMKDLLEHRLSNTEDLVIDFKEKL